MPYDTMTHAYEMTFATPPAAQPTYQITTSSSSGTSATWNLVADPPTFTGSIASPASGATFHAGDAIKVTWSLQPADYVLLELFVRGQSGWVNVYTSPPIPSVPDVDGGNVSSEAIPSAPDGGVSISTGTYLINVSFTKANCNVTSDGCVHSSTVASAQIAVQ